MHVNRFLVDLFLMIFLFSSILNAFVQTFYCVHLGLWFYIFHLYSLYDFIITININHICSCVWCLVINVGTSSQFTFLMPEGFVPFTDSVDKSSPVEHVPFFSGRYLSETASLNGGNVLAAFVNMLADWFHEFGLYSVGFTFYY